MVTHYNLQYGNETIHKGQELTVAACVQIVDNLLDVPPKDLVIVAVFFSRVFYKEADAVLKGEGGKKEREKKSKRVINESKQNVKIDERTSFFPAFKSM